MSEYANYVEQAAYEDGLAKGRAESTKRINQEQAAIDADFIRQYQRQIAELEQRINLALEINADPCIPGFVGDALRGLKLEDMPEFVQAIIHENRKEAQDE